MAEQKPAAYVDVAEVDPATAAKSLTGMRDIAPAQPVSWRPATAGWYVLFAIFLLAIVRAGWMIRRRWRARAYRRMALVELNALERQLSNGGAPAHAISAINALVKRVRLSAAPRSRVASLSGAAWLKDLDTTWTGNQFSGGPGRLLADAPYRGADDVPDADRRALIALVRDWIRGHRA